MNIIFLFSGQSRTSPFSHKGRSNEILNSYNQYLFTDNFKKMFNYKVYVSTDDIHLQDFRNYFGDKIGNIHLLNTEFYQKQIENRCQPIDTYLEKYNRKDFTGFWKYEGSIHQHYKILDCYNLYRNDGFPPCDFIVRIRMDTKMTSNFTEILMNFILNPKLQLIMDWDFFAIGRPDIMKCYCTGLENNYGNYTFQTPVPDEPPIMPDYNIIEKGQWTYAPERQLFEMLFEYCNNNGLNIKETIKERIFCCSKVG